MRRERDKLLTKERHRRMVAERSDESHKSEEKKASNPHLKSSPALPSRSEVKKTPPKNSNKTRHETSHKR
jgi:hypothetical protein